MAAQRFRMRHWRYLAIFLAAVVLAFVRYFELGVGDVPRSVEGRARLIDGDSFRLGGHEIRLLGIDAPEGRQTCERDGGTWPCGSLARQKLASLLPGGNIRCDVDSMDQFDRLLAVCYAGGQEINRVMVEHGWAVAYGSRYQLEERAAQKTRRGLWSGRFERPRVWRDRQSS